ncbi:putative mitochondrial saccharopine dehydrogenase-like oxidoreductase [Hibiscus syriacus]|uniref:Mitochondrial saccharopine dehydrogenase-like oxidoreductase n=1 Tax=Hibiscus syriacus TaxID=106335 RepID=A0A6A2XHC2_HIBSY|nr:probable mitochondrial saccharopine dehydrogenase-like oxidoreductase At5g39410 [Hibiscus syriacus]KAE8655767.1 putative mitochondrial saccharopine dehydrogenase-like oxidoreductase [Hibiscus syriacus]
MQTTQIQNPIPLYDIIILGASGFTGKYVVKEALKFLNIPSSPLKTLALAGRSHEKLTKTLQWAAPPPSPDVSIIIADTTDPASLLSLCNQTKLLLNCVGPYRIHGEPVVAACASSGCDYLDITGESEFMEKMGAKYHEKAGETGSLIVSACGFDSIPAEMGVLFNTRQWVSPAVPNHLTAYVSLESDKRIVGNFATYESAVLAVANMDELQELRRSRPRKPTLAIPGPPPPEGPSIEYQEQIGLRAVRLPSADAIVVQRTLVTLMDNPRGLPGIKESPEHTEKREAYWSSVKPAHFGVKIASKSLLGIYRIIGVGIFIGLLSRISFGRWLLLKFPSFFSFGWFRKTGPSEEELRSASFKMWFVGYGFSDSSLASETNSKPDMQIITRVTGPEIGYVTTPISLIQCALIVLSQRKNLPKGGVYTPGIIFGPDLQERLQENRVSFDLVSKTTLRGPTAA